MSKQSISEKSLVIRNETQQYANTRGRVADVIDDINETKLDRNASNLTAEDLSVWQNIIGSGIFLSPFVVQQPNNPLGMNGHQVNAGDKIEDFLRLAFRKATNPTYTVPTADFGSATTSTANIEIGETKTISLVGKYNKNDGGSATAHRIYKGSTKVADANTFSESVTFGTNSISYGYEVDYEAGPVKNDNLGNPSPTGQITGGTTNRASITYTPNSKIFYGVAGANVTDFRTLPNWAWKGTTALTIATGTTLKDFYIVVPSDKSVTSVIDVESSNNEILPQFAETTVSVNDAGGTGRSYKLYKWPAGSTYPTNHTLKITIG